MQNGNNATQAYMECRPGVIYKSANSSGTILINSPKIRKLLAQKIAKLDPEHLASTNQLLVEAETVRLNAMEGKNYGPALRAIDTKAKLVGAYGKETKAVEKYNLFIQQFVKVEAKEVPRIDEETVIDIGE